MSGDLVLPSQNDLEFLDDPGNRIVVSCERAKAWLSRALEGNDIEQIIEIKCQAEAIRVYTLQKELGKDAELAAAEVVRRAERCIGLAIRKGQAEGRIRHRGQHVLPDGKNRSPSDFVSTTKEWTAAYAMTDGVTDAAFDAAIQAGKAQRNLSRANVVRQVRGNGDTDRWDELAELAAQGYTSAQIAKKLGFHPSTVVSKARALGIDIQADRVVGGTRRIDPNRVLREFVGTLESLVPSCDLIQIDRLDREVLDECFAVLDEALRHLNSFRRRLRKDRT